MTPARKLAPALSLGPVPATGRDRLPERIEVPEHRPVQITLLGGFDVTVQGRRMPVPPGRPAAVIKFVATRGSAHVEELAESLWPDAENGTGRTRLRNVLLRVRQHCGDIVERDGERVRLADDAAADVAAFDADSRRALAAPTGDPVGVDYARRALACYRGELLPEDRYEDWTVPLRERFRRRYLDLLDLLASAAERGGETAEALRLTELAIDEEPLDEDRYLRAVRPHRHRERPIGAPTVCAPSPLWPSCPTEPRG